MEHRQKKVTIELTIPKIPIIIIVYKGGLLTWPRTRLYLFIFSLLRWMEVSFILTKPSNHGVHSQIMILTWPISANAYAIFQVAGLSTFHLMDRRVPIARQADPAVPRPWDGYRSSHGTRWACSRSSVVSLTLEHVDQLPEWQSKDSEGRCYAKALISGIAKKCVEGPTHNICRAIWRCA